MFSKSAEAVSGDTQISQIVRDDSEINICIIIIIYVHDSYAITTITLCLIIYFLLLSLLPVVRQTVSPKQFNERVTKDRFPLAELMGRQLG